MSTTIERMKRRASGFTLIELLVVIAIIGILAGIVLVSFTGIQARGRDAERVSDIRQMILILQAEATADHTEPLVDCDGVNDRTTECTAPGDVSQFAGLGDPLYGDDAPCSATVDEECAYSISAADGTGGATVSDWQICFYLEAGAAGLDGETVHRVTSDSASIGDAQAGCLTVP